MNSILQNKCEKERTEANFRSKYSLLSRTGDSSEMRLPLGGREGRGGGTLFTGKDGARIGAALLTGEWADVAGETVWPTGGREGKAGGVEGGLFCKVIEAIPRFTAALASIAVVILLDPFLGEFGTQHRAIYFEYLKQVAKLNGDQLRTYPYCHYRCLYPH